MKTIFRVLMVLVGFFSASIAFADDGGVACGNYSGSHALSSSASSSTPGTGHATVTESITTSSIVFEKCGAPTVEIVTRVHMTRNNGPEVNDMERDIILALFSQGYHPYKEKCSRGRFAQGRTVTITVE